MGERGVALAHVRTGVSLPPIVSPPLVIYAMLSCYPMCKRYKKMSECSSLVRTVSTGPNIYHELTVQSSTTRPQIHDKVNKVICGSSVFSINETWMPASSLSYSMFHIVLPLVLHICLSFRKNIPANIHPVQMIICFHCCLLPAVDSLPQCSAPCTLSLVVPTAKAYAGKVGEHGALQHSVLMALRYVEAQVYPLHQLTSTSSTILSTRPGPSQPIKNLAFTISLPILTASSQSDSS